MGFRNKIRKRFLIILVVVVLLTGGLSIKTMMMDQKFKSSGCKDNQSGLCSDLQKWRFFPEEKICQMKQESEQNSYLTSSTDLMKYVSHDVGHLASLLHGKLRDSISCQRSERGQLEPCLDWTSRILTEDVNYQHKAVIVLLLIISCILEVFEQEIRKDKKMKIWSCPETNVFKKLKALLSNWIPLFCPPWINHDEQQQADEGLQFKQGKKYAWMKDPLRWNDCFTEYISFSVLDRVASYRPLFSTFPQTNMPSVLTLAEAGFSYPGRGLIVECQECRSVVDITNFNVEGHHHREGCSFAKQDGNMASNSSSNENQDVDTDSAEAVHIESVTLNEQVILDEQLATFNNSSNGYQLLDETSSPITPLQNVLLSSEAGTCPKHLDIVHAVQLEHNCQDEVPEQQQANQAAETEEQQQCQSATAIQQQINPLSISPPEENGACAGSCGSTHVTHDLVAKCNATLFDLVDFDAEEEKSQGLRIDLAEACLKNPGHYTNFLMGQLQEDFIPTNARHPDVFKFMKLFGKLVVRLVVSKLSSNRPHFLKNKDESKYRFGTGIATAKYIDNDTAANMETSRKWSSVKKYLPLLKSKGNIYIKTNRHLVYDDAEAQNTVVEFFYDDIDRKGIIFAKGISIKHSNTLGDFESILKCKISDLSMMEFVKNTEDEIETLAKRFPKNIKEGLMKRVFIISHPHGREKVMSYGEYVMVKYALKVGQEQEQPKIEMQRINNHTQISENHNDIRKILLYTAETCKGSSGAVVISFKKTKHNNDEDIVLDLWMHSGMCKINGLNASVMRELTNEDIANHSNPNTFRPSVQDELEQEADNAANQVVSCPLYTVMGAPTHPAYVTYQKRLESYPITFHHVHTAAELADAGFFCAGYADCVRCFHCGLGLRSWKPGDNIYEEHRKNRSDCQFLQMKLKAAGIHQTESHNFQQGARSQVSAQQQAAASSTNENQQNHPPKFTMVVQTSEPSVTQSSQKESGMLNNQTEMMEQTMNPVPSDQHKITVGMVLCNQAEAGNPAVPQITSVNILEKEQHYLKQILTCKVCSRNQVKDLFLPCGELVACLECSKLLTHCPSCNTKILATITTYFS